MGALDKTPREPSPAGAGARPSMAAEDFLQPEYLIKLKSILDVMADGVYIANRSCCIEYANPALEKEFGPLRGQRCYEYLHERTTPCPGCRSGQVFAGKTVFWEWTSPRTGKIYDLFGTPLHNTDGTISKLEIFHDITEHKRLQREVSQIGIREQQRIAGTSRSIGPTIAGIANDVHGFT